MPAGSVHRRTRNQEFTIVILPESETGKPKRFTVKKLQLIGGGVGLFFVVAVTVLFALIYTPIGVYVPIPNPELENRYHKQIVSIQERLTQLTEELMSLRDYNIRLRKALGENISAEDSAFIAAQITAQRITRQVRGEQQSGPDFNQVTGYQPYATPTSSVIVKSVRAELPMALPVRGYITQEFDPERQHFGIDFAGKEGSIISAAADGSVIFSEWTYDDGYMIMLAHGSGYRTTYKHNQALLKPTGTFVRRGEPIALLGNSGKTSYGPHLHFEVWKESIPRNPKEFLLTLE